MKTPLPNINIESIYFKDEKRLPLPKRMAQCTPDTQQALIEIGKAVEKKKGTFVFIGFVSLLRNAASVAFGLEKREEKGFQSTARRQYARSRTRF